MRLFVLLASALLSACIYIPAIEPEPYKDVNLDSIDLGKSTRADIVKLLGEPDITRRDDSIWIYGQDRDVGFLILLLKPGYAGFMRDFQFLVFEFNQDYVKSFDLVEEGLGCSTSGICLAAGWGPTGRRPDLDEWVLVNDLTVVVSGGEDDKTAKKFHGIPDKCAFYIYQKYRGGRAAVGSIRNVLMAEKAYLYVVLTPGIHPVTAMQRNDWSKEIFVSEELECESGDVLFVKIAEKSWSWGRQPMITVVDSNVGREAILKRNLILLPQNQLE